MSDTVFPFPGGKSKYSDWIVNHFPAHDCYVEVFGGSGAVLLNKPRSTVEVYNDINRDITRFFRVLRERPEALEQRVWNMDYSRSLYDEIANRWFDKGDRPDDDVQAASEFFFLRYTQFGASIERTGFSASITSNHSRTYYNKTSNLQTFADRFRGVTIENRDWEKVVDKYDSENTFFYLDPPYVELDRNDYYGGGSEFDHEAFVDSLSEFDGRWMISYSTLPDQILEYDVEVIERNQRWSMATGKEDEEQYAIERLVLNYDPEAVQSFHSARYQEATSW